MPVAPRDEGMAVSTSLSTMVWTRALWTSTIGDSPVTVIVSSRLPTRRSPLTVATKSPLSSMPSRLHGTEPGQRERHRVSAGTEIDDSILARVVGDDRADLFNQDRASGFDRHARQHRAGRVFDDTGNGGLRERRRREEQDHQQGRTLSLADVHIAFLLTVGGIAPQDR